MELPCAECRGKCCTFPVFAKNELLLARMSKGIPKNAKVMPLHANASVVHLADGTCPYLEDGRCSIHSIRPKVCRDYGVVPALPCAYLYPEKANAEANRLVTKFRR